MLFDSQASGRKGDHTETYVFYVPKVDGDDMGEERRSLLWAGRNQKDADTRQRLVKAAFYAVQVFYSFFIM